MTIMGIDYNTNKRNSCKIFKRMSFRNIHFFFIECYAKMSGISQKNVVDIT